MMVPVHKSSEGFQTALLWIRLMLLLPLELPPVRRAFMWAATILGLTFSACSSETLGLPAGLIIGINAILIVPFSASLAFLMGARRRLVEPSMLKILAR